MVGGNRPCSASNDILKHDTYVCIYIYIYVYT